MWRTLSVWQALLLLACSHRAGAPVRQPDGGYALSCKSPLSDCLRHAEQVCKDQGYTVTEARDVRELLGHESGQSQVVIERSEATVYCGTRPTPPTRLTRQAEPSESVASAVPAPAPKPTPACVPGASQACAGPAGCTGGQTCSADGTRFDSCDCGGK